MDLNLVNLCMLIEWGFYFVIGKVLDFIFLGVNFYNFVYLFGELVKENNFCIKIVILLNFVWIGVIVIN